MSTILLDTNAYSLFVGGDNKIKKAFDEARLVYLSATSVGELYAGFLKGNRLNENMSTLNNFFKLEKVTLLAITRKTSEIYGKVAFQLHKAGTPIPQNDIWVAASAIESKSVVVTYDSHFLAIPKLKIWPELEKNRSKG
jgi:predicted nucleic acid-binding protein